MRTRWIIILRMICLDSKRSCSNCLRALAVASFCFTTASICGTPRGHVRYHAYTYIERETEGERVCHPNSATPFTTGPMVSVI